MGDNQLVAVACVLLSLIGIALLHFSANTPVVHSLDGEAIDSKIMLQGIVHEKRIHTTNVFLTVNNDSVVFFSPDGIGPYAVLPGQRVCITGTIKPYRGALELVGEALESC